MTATPASDSEGIANDTLADWACDNRGSTRAGASDGPFRGGKGSMFEGRMRVPKMNRWRGVLALGA